MSPDDRDREELVDLLADLEATLTELRSELRTDPGVADPTDPEATDRDGGRDAAGRRHASDEERSGSGIPEPPSVTAVLRFTEQYTLPTLITTLEATIRALELLRGALRLADGRPARGGMGRRERSTAAQLGDGVAGVGREAVSGVERALSELEAALSESDIPDERAGDDVLAEVRELSAEIADRLDDSQTGASGRDRPSRDAGEESGRNSGGVTIEVTDGTDGTRESDADGEKGSRPAVDVEAELESIRDEVHGPAVNRGGEERRDSEPDDGPGTDSESDSGSEPEGGDDAGGEPE